MTSHGVPRRDTREERTAEHRQRELKEISQYQALVNHVNEQVAASAFTPELLQKTAELLNLNPEYYTAWNHRRRIYVHEFHDLAAQVLAGELDDEGRQSQVLDIIRLDLQFLFPLLLKFPKCYWIWNHRLWLLDQATALLPAAAARQLWQDELGLVGKMLSRDSRNFHGWGYRRTVVQNLESPALQGTSMSRSEFDYTKKMIGLNLSNFSAWHSRSKLILRVLDEEQASDAERRQMLDDELELIHKALFDPYDQSLWFYHQSLMCAFDRDQAPRSMAPGLSDDDRLRYLAAERAFVEDVLDDADDCKWAYLALVEGTLLEAKLRGTLHDQDKRKITAWLQTLRQLDPLRRGRWDDVERTLPGEAGLVGHKEH